MICKDCNEDLPRIKHAYDNRKSQFKDDKGRLWNGFVCPSCKFAGKQVPTSSVPNTIRRLCRKCTKSLPTSRYFQHEECAGALEEQYNSFEWGYQSWLSSHV